ncbi:DNA-binding Xre family transcriptional regulator [Paenibacillus cellulosilyticus]|uniref:DNA-binding Xre family transcriptional regulator n=1 Tax=Paenibacillus cellulosilyticus TaxID=375489 RepID=A0A2V2YTC6_9BACL|nr:helix-turn-helix transcriptional regulator [Paenibacillus cellulosilyticus]PWW02509.1 DNA-binding Xre family transcriptional regulator [Paenibacillus cellulosilyticus]
MRLRIKLKEILVDRGMTQMELSALANVTQSKISNLCNNNMKELNIGILERIASALKIEDISELIQFEK